MNSTTKATGATIDATDTTFNDEVNSDGITIIDFWAPWCGPCKAFGPVYAASAGKHTDIAHLKVNVDENPHLSGYFNIHSIPTTVFIRDGITVGVIPGAMNKGRLDDLISQTRKLNMDEVRKEAGAKSGT